MFSASFHLHTNNYQHSWKWLVINPYHYVDVYILCIYSRVDGLDLVLKSHQQLSFVLLEMSITVPKSASPQFFSVCITSMLCGRRISSIYWSLHSTDL